MYVIQCIIIVENPEIRIPIILGPATSLTKVDIVTWNDMNDDIDASIKTAP